MVTITTNNGIVTIETETRKAESPIDLVSIELTDRGIVLSSANTPQTEFSLSEGIKINEIEATESDLYQLLWLARLIKGSEFVPSPLPIFGSKWQYPLDWYNLYDVIADDVPPEGYKRACSWLISDTVTYPAPIEGVTPSLTEVDLSLYTSAAVSDTLVRTSDGYFGVPRVHTWDKTKDKINSEGWATRWLIVYVPVAITNYAIPQTRLDVGVFLPVKGLILGQIQQTRSDIFGISGINPYDHHNEVEFLDYEEGAYSALISGYGKASIKRWRCAPLYTPATTSGAAFNAMYGCVELELPSNTVRFSHSNTFAGCCSLRYLKIPASCTQFGNTGKLPALKTIEIEEGWTNSLDCSFAESYFVSLESWRNFFSKLGFNPSRTTITIPARTLAEIDSLEIISLMLKGWTIAGA